jgi:hypothetical protein
MDGMCEFWIVIIGDLVFAAKFTTYFHHLSSVFAILFMAEYFIYLYIHTGQCNLFLWIKNNLINKPK